MATRAIGLPGRTPRHLLPVHDRHVLHVFRVLFPLALLLCVAPGCATDASRDRVAETARRAANEQSQELHSGQPFTSEQAFRLDRKEHGWMWSSVAPWEPAELQAIVDLAPDTSVRSSIVFSRWIGYPPGPTPHSWNTGWPSEPEEVRTPSFEPLDHELFDHGTWLETYGPILESRGP